MAVSGMQGPLTYAFDFCQFCNQSVIVHGGNLLITQLARVKVLGQIQDIACLQLTQSPLHSYGVHMPCRHVHVGCQCSHKKLLKFVVRSCSAS